MEVYFFFSSVSASIKKHELAKSQGRAKRVYIPLTSCWQVLNCDDDTEKKGKSDYYD